MARPLFFSLWRPRILIWPCLAAPQAEVPKTAFRSLKMAFAGHLQRDSDKDFEGLPFWRILGFPTAAPQGGLASMAGQGVETIFS